MTYDYILLDTGSSVPLYQQLYLAVKNAIEAGHLAKGEKLPSIRKLAGDLKLSCTTVEAAYQQLCVEGYLTARPQRGYFVLSAPKSGALPLRPAAIRRPEQAQKIRYNFGSDCVDTSCIDLKIWQRHIREVLNRQEVIASYGDHQGEWELREALSAYSYGARGVIASPEQIVIGAGTQPLLSILCGLLRGADERIALEEPGFPQAEQIFSDCGLQVLRLPADDSGIRMDALRESGVKQVFVSPSNRIQTGTGIPVSRRYELLDWARETGGILVEDDYNGELRYNARPIPAMQGMDRAQTVVYIGSFSKLLLPSVRIGYMVLPERLLELYQTRVARYNQTASKTEQLALSRYIREGQLERQLRRLRKRYAAKSSALIQALKNAFGSHTEILLQETPLCVNLRLHTSLPGSTLCEIAARNGVRVMPEKGVSSGVVLGFAGIPLNDIEPAVQRLKEAWGDVVSRNH